MERIKDLVLRMEDMSAAAGLPRFDRVRLVSDPGEPDELWFHWEDDTKLIIAVELSASAEMLAASLAQATAGNPVLN